MFTILDIDQIKSLIDKWQIEKETIEKFLICFNNYSIEQKEEFYSYFGEFEQTRLEYYIKKISVELKNFPEFDYNHLVSYLWFEYKGKVVGEFRLLFTLNGEIYDNNLIMY